MASPERKRSRRDEDAEERRGNRRSKDDDERQKRRRRSPESRSYRDEGSPPRESRSSRDGRRSPRSSRDEPSRESRSSKQSRSSRDERRSPVRESRSSMDERPAPREARSSRDERPTPKESRSSRDERRQHSPDASRSSGEEERQDSSPLKRDREGQAKAASNKQEFKVPKLPSPDAGQDWQQKPDAGQDSQQTQAEEIPASILRMQEAEAALEANEKAKQKKEANYEYSGALAAETNTVNGIPLVYSEPTEARKPTMRWRLYVFKGEEALEEPLLIHRQSCYLFGRERKVVDIPTDHPSCSKQHAVIQYRLVEKVNPEDETSSRRIRPYLMDLGSTNGTFLNGERLEPQRYYELFEKDTIKFGNSSREYVLLHADST